MPVNVAFGPSAGLVGQFGYGTGKRQYADQKAQLERQSKRQMLSDAMNFTKFLQDTRRPEEDQRRSMERMREQQRLQKDSIDHQSAIRKTDYAWEQDQKNELRVKQSEALVELDARLKREMANLPADMSPLEKQHYYQRQYDVGAHRIGTAKAPGAEIKPFKHYDHKGNDYRINADRSITDLGAERSKRRSEAAKQTTDMVVRVSEAKDKIAEQVSKPHMAKIGRLEARRVELVKEYVGGVNISSEAPKKSDYTEDGEYDKKAHEAATGTWTKRNNQYNEMVKTYNTDLKAIDDAIRDEETAMRRNIISRQMTLANSLGGAGTDNIGGPVGRTLFDDIKREKERLQSDEEAYEQRLEERETFEAAKRGDPEAREAFLSDPRYQHEGVEWYPGERRVEAGRLLEQGGPTRGVPFRLESGGTLQPSTMQAIINNDRIRELYPEVSKRDIKKFNTEYEEKNPVSKHTIPDSKTGKPTKVNLKRIDAAAAEESWNSRKNYVGKKAALEKVVDRPKNEAIKVDLKNQIKVVDRLIEIEEIRHTKLQKGEGDILAEATGVTPDPLNAEYQKLLVEEQRLREILEKEDQGTLAGERFQKQLREFRDAAGTHEAIDEPRHPLFDVGPAFAEDTPAGWLQRKALKRAGDVADAWDWLKKEATTPMSQEDITESWGN